MQETKIKEFINKANKVSEITLPSTVIQAINDFDLYQNEKPEPSHIKNMEF